MIEKLDHQCVGLATSEQEIIELTRNTTPDAIILDTSFVDAKGLKKIEKTIEAMNTSIIFSSTRKTDGITFGTAQNSSGHYLSKPYLITDLKSEIEKIRPS